MARRGANKAETEQIPEAVRHEVQRVVDDFNAQAFSSSEADAYVVRFSGRFAYVARFGTDYATPSPVCRLTYTGDTAEWEFAIYKHSRMKYDPEEWFFPGAGKWDGSVRSALEAGLEAYP